MSSKFDVFGVSHNAEIHLHEAETLSEADRWVGDYTRAGNWGGHESIDVRDGAGKVLSSIPDPHLTQDPEPGF